MIKYSRIREVYPLKRGTKRSAGIDFYVPEWSDELFNDFLKINEDSVKYDQIKMMNDMTGRTFLPHFVIPPHTHLLIPTGIKINLEDFRESRGFLRDDETIGFALIAHNKSSVGKKQLDVAATVVDEDYQGEIHFSITNTSSNASIINFGQKLEQFLLVVVVIDDFVEVSQEHLYSTKSERCEGAFGSTDENNFEQQHGSY